MAAEPKTDVFFDTNIIVYFASDIESKADISGNLLKRGGVVSVQVLNEFARVALAKRRMSIDGVRTTLAAVKSVCAIEPLTLATHERGLELCERLKVNIFDAMIVAAAQLAGCRVLYSEDMQDGRVIDGLTIRNPY